MDTDRWAVVSVCDERLGSVLCQLQVLWACGPTAAPEVGSLVLCSTQATPNKMALLTGRGFLRAECHRQADELKEEHYLRLYPDGKLVCPGGSLRRHIGLYNLLCL